MMYRYYTTTPCTKDRSDMEISGNRIIEFRVLDQPVLIKSTSKSKPDFWAYALVDYDRLLTPEEETAHELSTDCEYLTYHGDVFRIVDFLPRMETWNINMKDGYIPFCRVASGRQIDTNYLLAIKTPYAKQVMQVMDMTHVHQLFDLVTFLEEYLASDNHENRKLYHETLGMLYELKKEFN